MVLMGLKEHSTMLKSNRKFGVEVEFICPSGRALSQIKRQMNVVDDGSLRPHPFAGEWVTPILCGETGEDHIHRGCSILKKNRASAEPSCTSVHVHLDGQKNRTVTRHSKLPEITSGKIIAVSSAVLKQQPGFVIDELMQGNTSSLFAPVRSSIDHVRYYSMCQLSRHPTANYTFFHIEEPDRFPWLRRVFYFYTVYSQVMEGIVSNSRKFGNMYCIPLGESYDPNMILACKSMEALAVTWYKGNPPNGHYDGSRYHNVNLHSFFHGQGTVEIRSHGGTTDAHKILLWVNLHQTILDKLETCSDSDIAVKNNIYKSFIDFLPDELNKSYVKRLLGYYSNIKIKKCAD